MRRALPLLLVTLLPLRAGSESAYPFSVATERNGRSHDIVARNRGPSPISVRLTLSATDNVRPSQALPLHSQPLLLVPQRASPVPLKP